MASVPGTKYDQEPVFANVTVHGAVSLVIYYRFYLYFLRLFISFHYYVLLPSAAFAYQNFQTILLLVFIVKFELNHSLFCNTMKVTFSSLF